MYREELAQYLNEKRTKATTLSYDGWYVPQQSSHQILKSCKFDCTQRPTMESRQTNPTDNGDYQTNWQKENKGRVALYGLRKPQCRGDIKLNNVNERRRKKVV